MATKNVEEKNTQLSEEEQTKAKASGVDDSKSKEKSEDKPIHTEAETTALVNEAVQKANIKSGRNAAALKVKEDALKEKEVAFEKEENRRREEIKESLRGDAEALKTFAKQEEVRQREREVEKREAAANARELEVKADDDVRSQENLINAIANVATEHKLDATKFATACTDLKLTTPEQVEALAAVFDATPQTEEEKKKALLTDTGKGSGASSPTAEAKLKSRYPSMYK